MCASAERRNSGVALEAGGRIPPIGWNNEIILDPLKTDTRNGSIKSQDGIKREYDPYSERELSRQYSNTGAFFHLLKGGLGSGILAMPMAFKHSGLVLGLVGTVVAGVVCTHCMVILVRSAQTLYHRMHVPALGMGETAEAAFQSGPKRLRPLSQFARNFVKYALFFCYAMAMSSYIIFIGDAIEQVVNNYVGYKVVDKRAYIALLTIPLLPLCQLRLLKHLVPCSFIANSCIVVGFSITVYYLFRDIPDPGSRRLGVASIQGMPIFFSTALFAMEGIGSVMPIENTMRNPRKMAGWTGLMTLAMSCIVVLFACMGFLGYLKFGDATFGNIALNLPTSEKPAQVVKILLAIAILFTIPVQFFVCADILWSFVAARYPPERHFVAESVVRALLLLACFVLALAVPNLELIISLVGAIFFSALGIFTPAVVETVVDWEQADRATRIGLAGKNGTLVLVSIFTAVSGVYASLYDAIAG